MSGNAPENPRTPPTVPSGAPRLRLLASTQEGQVQRCMDRPVCLIGSRRDCDLPLPHPDISKIHAAILNTGSAILVRDLASRSGTFVNDGSVRLNVLRPNDTLRVGSVTIVVEFEEHPQDAPNADPLHLPHPVSLEWSGGRVELSDNAAVIGRRSVADLVVDTPDVSLAHALLFALGDRLAVCDLGSRSGTLLNGQRVDLAWLIDGDRLAIGGEEIVVHCAGGEPAQLADKACPAADERGLLSETALRPPETPATSLSDLEQIIAAVHQQVAAARSRIDEHTRCLEQREADLARRCSELEVAQTALRHEQAAVQQREQALGTAEATAQQRLAELTGQERQLADKRAELEAQEKAIERQRNELDTLAAELKQQRDELEVQRASLASEVSRHEAALAALEQQRQAVEQAAATCREREGAADRRAAELDAAAADLAQARAGLESQQASLASEQSALAEAKGALELREQDAANRLQAVELREQQAAEREAGLAAREAREAEMARKIAEFKAALGQASQVFASAGRPSKSPGGQVSDGLATAPPNTPEPSSSNQAGNDLPAPVVDQPLFSAGRASPPADWPPELRERFRVLRRVSNKTDEELLAQVWHDREKVLVQEGRSGNKCGRGKSGPLIN